MNPVKLALKSLFHAPIVLPSFFLTITSQSTSEPGRVSTIIPIPHHNCYIHSAYYLIFFISLFSRIDIIVHTRISDLAFFTISSAFSLCVYHRPCTHCHCFPFFSSDKTCGQQNKNLGVLFILCLDLIWNIFFSFREEGELR